MNPASDLVNKLWRLCAVLRKDGITYQQYVTELTYLLFLKMMAEQKREEGPHSRGHALARSSRCRGAAATRLIPEHPGHAPTHQRFCRSGDARNLRELRDLHPRADQPREAGDR